ncbi:MAG TPA: AAA family ATPase, partial [Alphaproteobacteria bacterium]|nr:AAA family ATPase [Alphaproteobacteria bacterium]
ELLNRIRNNTATQADMNHINSRVVRGAAENDGFHITLTSTNKVADDINEAHLKALKGKLYKSTAHIEGKFGEEYHPTPLELTYKIGAQIMLVNNDSERRWVNGTLGTIEEMRVDAEKRDYMRVKLLDGGAVVDVYPHDWEVYRFGVEDGAITSEPVGTFTQFPFRLAWAITIHKSQGKTFSRVVVDVGRGAFAAGQMYVALSRCTSFEGLTLKTPITLRDIRTDPQIVDFMGGHAALPPPVADEKTALIHGAIEAGAALDIIYIKADGTQVENKIIPLNLSSARYQGEAYEGMKARCTETQEERMFRVDRIVSLKRA